MGIMRNSISGAVAAAIIVSSAAPALAEDGHHGGGYYRGYGYHDSYRHDDHHDNHVGGIIAGIAVIGLFAAFASAASKSNRHDRDRNEDDRDTRRDDGQRLSITSEDAAVDACAQAAQAEGGRLASLREITLVDANRDGWDIEGIVEQRKNWRDRSGANRRFTCTVRFGAIKSLEIDRG